MNKDSTPSTDNVDKTFRNPQEIEADLSALIEDMKAALIPFKARKEKLLQETRLALEWERLNDFK